MAQKNCSKCKQYKELSEFYKDSRTSLGVRPECKDCAKSNNQSYYENNCELVKERVKKYADDNKELLKQSRKKYQDKNTDKLRIYLTKYQKENKDELRIKQNAYLKKKLEIDVIFRLKQRIKNLIRTHFRRLSSKKHYKTTQIIGIDAQRFKNYLEYTWFQNYGTEYAGEPVHIDHIIPISTAKTEEEVIKLNHYTNLQYLTPEDNIRKGSKIYGPSSKS